ncbi:MAG: hypothetical protein KC422_18455 [Trueperaceae bacterium]|nr:hypothetical protein [Trueperaceae bacterium]
MSLVHAEGLAARDHGLDLFKSLLVVGMVSAHTIQFLSQRRFTLLLGFSEYINLISFSGFLFAFGYGTFLAYFQKPFSQIWQRLLISGLKTLLAFYVSGFAFRILVDHKRLFSVDFWNIILLNDIPGYSEFLLSFSFVMFLALPLFMPIKAVLKRPFLFWALIGILLATTFFPYELVHSKQLGLLVGTKEFAAFPVLQYVPYYLLGMFFALYKLGWHRLSAIISIAATLIYYGFVWQLGRFPSRFPPSLLWIIGPAGFLYLYYLVSRWLGGARKLPNLVLRPGKNVLFYLLLSNLMIFGLSTVYRNAFGLATSLLTALGILATCHFLLSITRAR